MRAFIFFSFFATFLALAAAANAVPSDSSNLVIEHSDHVSIVESEGGSCNNKAASLASPLVQGLAYIFIFANFSVYWYIKMRKNKKSASIRPLLPIMSPLQSSSSSSSSSR